MKLSVVDFLRPPAAPRIGWVLLGVGALALTSAVWLQQRWAGERRAALQQQELAAAQTQPKPTQPVELTLGQRRRLQAQTELRKPWLAALRAIESATTDPVYLLSLTIEPTTGLVKLQADAPSFDHALAYVQRLDEGGALQPATLLSHAEAVSTRPRPPVVKFSVSTQWNAHWNTR